MPICSRCGQANEDSSRFCVACGNRLDAPPPGTSPSPSAQPAPDAPPSNAWGPQEQQYPHPEYPGAGHGGPAQPPGAMPPGGYPSQAGAAPGAYPGVPSPPLTQLPHTSPIPPGQEPKEHPDARQHTAHEPAKSPTSAGPGSVKLAFAETAPPVLGEDVLSRKIPDRGAQQRKHQSSPDGVLSSGSAPRLDAVLNVPSDAPRVLTALFISYESNPLGQAWMIHQGSNLVGRAGAVAGADLELPHATVSSKHALLMASAHPGRLVVTDFGSTNGTFVNDTAMAAHQPRELCDGDRVRFGLFPVIVKII